MSTTPTYAPNVTIDNVIDALASFIQLFVGTAQIVRGQQSRVAQPPDPCVVLTELLSSDLETPTVTMDNVNQILSVITPGRIDIQIDFYGSSAGDQCKAVKTFFRTNYAADQFSNINPSIVPLYCSDGIQAPLVSAEMQWEQRWTMTASLQYNPQVTVAQQSAVGVFINSLNNVDVELIKIVEVDGTNVGVVTDVDGTNTGIIFG